VTLSMGCRHSRREFYNFFPKSRSVGFARSRPVLTVTAIAGSVLHKPFSLSTFCRGPMEVPQYSASNKVLAPWSMTTV
jgi:hypothetical protein